MQSDLIAVTDVMRTAGTYRAWLRTRSPAGAGERVLENAHCEVLMNSVAVVIALTITSPEARARRSGDAAPLALSGSAHASALLGVLPRLGPGFGGALALEAWQSLRLELRATLQLRQSTTFDTSSLGGSFQLLSFAARVCRIWRFGSLELGPCVGADVRQLRANGFGAAEVFDGDATWWAPALAAFARWRLAPAFAILVATEGAVPISRRRFVFVEVGTLHRPSPVSLQLLVAPEVQF